MIGDTLYRYEEYDPPYLTRWIVEKETPKGCWVHPKYREEGDPDRKFVRGTAKKGFASRSKKGALVRYAERKQMQISYLERQLQQAKTGLGYAIDMLDAQEPET